MFRPRTKEIGTIAIFLIAFFIFESNGTSLRKATRIIMGSNAVPGEFPWQVSLRRSGRHICGGAIISDRHILTAGHCIVGIVETPYSELTVVTGLTRVDGPSQTYIVKDINVTQNYVPKTPMSAVKNDIAVISLTKKIVMNDLQKSIALPEFDVPKNVTAVVSGFGRMDPDGITRVTNLQKLRVFITKGTDCFDHGARILSNQICGITDKGTCTAKGDSGSPVVFDGKIIGIVSTATPCGMEIPDVYTNVFKFSDFIKKAMESI